MLRLFLWDRCVLYEPSFWFEPNLSLREKKWWCSEIFEVMWCPMPWFTTVNYMWQQEVCSCRIGWVLYCVDSPPYRTIGLWTKPMVCSGTIDAQFNSRRPVALYKKIRGGYWPCLQVFVIIGRSKLAARLDILDILSTKLGCCRSNPHCGRRGSRASRFVLFPSFKALLATRTKNPDSS